MVKMNSVLAVVASVFLVVACSGKGGMRSRGGSADVMPGSQQDLEVNVGDRAFFGFDSAVLDKDAQATLGRQAEWLRVNKHVKVTVEGHCDARGSREYNLALGERRAEAARAFLVAAGVDASRIQTISYGKERLAAVGHTEEDHAQNRRSVMIVN